MYFTTDFKNIIKEHGLSLLSVGLMPLYIFIISVIFKLGGGEEGFSVTTDLASVIASFVYIMAFLTMPIMFYGKVTDKKKGAQYIMLPASHAEKFVSMFLNAIIVFPVAIVALYLLTDWALAAIFPKEIEGALISWLGHEAAVLSAEDGNFTLKITGLNFFLPLMVSSAGLAGGLIYKKSKVAKTFMTCVISFILFQLTVVAVTARFVTKDMVMGMGTDNMFEHYAIFWYSFQTFCAVCCLVYIYFRTKKIQL